MVKILELFSGYGTASFALKKLGIDYNIVGYSDIDKYANKCFRQNHWTTKTKAPGVVDVIQPKELGDVKLIKPEELEDFDLLTGGFPCQAFSVAGKGLGELDPRGTLFWEIIRIAEVKKPRWMLLENVKGLTTKKHKPTFEKILSELARIGYFVHHRVLNTKDYGIPQNRERVWFVCFREKADYEKFTWPEKEELKIFIKDILEPEPVGAKYYLKEHQINKLLEALAKKDNNFQSRRYQKDVANTLAARDWKDPKVISSVQWDMSGKGHNSQEDRAYNVDGVMCTIPNANPSNKVNIFAMRSYPRRGTKEADGERFQNMEIREDGCSNSLTSVEKDNMLDNKGIFRRLTPRECFRLQGFLNDDINLEGISDTQAYKLAGNGQSVNVVSKIFSKMLLN
jgi:DNA (cytosine-5)-methyltransferase 1